MVRATYNVGGSGEQSCGVYLPIYSVSARDVARGAQCNIVVLPEAFVPGSFLVYPLFPES